MPRLSSTTWPTATPDDFGSLDSDTQEAIRDGMVTSILTVLLAALADDAEVTIAAGGITGDDSGGDSHDNLSASGGSIT